MKIIFDGEVTIIDLGSVMFIMKPFDWFILAVFIIMGIYLLITGF